MAEKPSFEERKKDLKQFDAKQVKPKENAAWTWIRTMFFSGMSLKDILKKVAENQIIPQIKDNFRNSLVSIIDMKLYKDHQTSSSSQPTSSFITNYVSYSDPKKETKALLESNQAKEKAVIESGYETPAFRDISQAKDFLRSMQEYVKKYQTISVYDLAWMQKKKIDFTWDSYEWNKEEILAIKEPTHINHPNTPWIVQLPKAHPRE